MIEHAHTCAIRRELDRLQAAEHVDNHDLDTYLSTRCTCRADGAPADREVARGVLILAALAVVVAILLWMVI